MTDLDSPRKNNDCYFYYYSTCAKGDNCTFRHEPSALGCETMCSFWKEGKCLNVHCNFRHMELRKNRKVIPCYWESQPVGCLKPHCPFMHQNAKPPTADESLESKTDSGTESADNTMNEKLNQMSDKSFKNTPVDALVVNFEEESDNESAPSNSPSKATNRAVKVKTLEEIKLEKIQAESAAYYSYPDSDGFTQQESNDPDDLRQRILDRIRSKNSTPSLVTDELKSSNKRQKEVDLNTSLDDTIITKFKKQKTSHTTPNVNAIKIKTLDEIRAERQKKNKQEMKSKETSDDCDSSVSSTCIDDIENKIATKNQKRKIKLRRKHVVEFGVNKEENVVTSAGNKNQGDSPKEEELESQSMDASDTINDKDMKNIDDNAQSMMNESGNDFNKTMDEVLLLEDDDDNSNVSLKAEDELLNEIDNLLDD